MIDDVKIICRYTCPSDLRDRYGACLAQILEALGQSNEWSEVASGLSLPDLSSRDSARGLDEHARRASQIFGRERCGHATMISQPWMCRRRDLSVAPKQKRAPSSI